VNGTLGTSVYYSFDASGNVAQRMSQAPAVLSSHVYDAYGAGQSTPAVANEPFGYGAQWGYYTDGETGLVALTYRYYDAGTGRFLNRDPSGYGGGINLYGYVGNNPANFVDPSGLCKTCGVTVPNRPAKMADWVIQYNMGAANAAFPNVGWYYDHVKNRGPWDYKQLGKQYENFGNFHFGATACAFGFPEGIGLREAGRAQQAAGTSRPEWGDPGPREMYVIGGGGKAPYGDDPNDSYWISQGYTWARYHYYRPGGTGGPTRSPLTPPRFPQN
jgi:type VI secretion system secreted protein VgrG